MLRVTYSVGSSSFQMQTQSWKSLSESKGSETSRPTWNGHNRFLIVLKFWKYWIGKNKVFGVLSCLWKIYLLGGLFTETGVTKLPSSPLAISPPASPSLSSFLLPPLYLTWQSRIMSNCVKISGPCVVRVSHRTSVIPKANPRILRRDEGKPPQPDYTFWTLPAKT